MSRRKSHKTADDDRLSSLPDDLLLRILSFLEFDDVIRTPPLSRRWRYLWTSVPSLLFGEDEEDRPWEPAAISNALFLSTAPQLESLHISFLNPIHLDSWFRFAVHKDIRHLNLLAGDDSSGANVHSSLYTRSSLESLKLSNFDLQLPPSIHLPSLKTLYLDRCRLSEDDFRVILSGCLNLEELGLRNCNEDAAMRIRAPTTSMLKHLWIEDFEGVSRSSQPKNNGVEVSAPSLLSLRLRKYLRRGYYSIKNSRSLSAVSLDFESMLEESSSSGYENGLNQLLKLLNDVSHVKTLKLCNWCCQVLSLREINQEKPVSFCMTSLELKTRLRKWDLLGMAYLLKGSLHLQELVVKIDMNNAFSKGEHDLSTLNLDDYEFDRSEYWKSLDSSLSCQLQQLKTVKIHGFMGSRKFKKTEWKDITIDRFINRRQNEVLLVKTLLQNCKGLEKMIIRATNTLDDSVCDEDRLKISQVKFNLLRRLILLPRASPSAEIVFTWD